MGCIGLRFGSFFWTTSPMAAYNLPMSRTIPAVFDAGVFRPLEPVELAEGTRVGVQIAIAAPPEDAAELSPEEQARQRAAILEMLAEIESLPIREPDDGFSGRDHDKVLYGAR